MMPKARLRPPRAGGLFGRRRNRRVRTAARAEPGDRMARLAARARRSARIALIVGLAAGGGAAAWGTHRFLTRSPHFAVRAVRVSPTQHVSAESLAARAGVALGANLFQIDLDEVGRDVAQEPWIRSARARRELPSTVVVDVVERDAACVVALGPLYLADADGAVFKRANSDEAAGLPVVTGIERDAYLADPDAARADVRQGLAAMAAWRGDGPRRPALGEVHVDRLAGLTLYTVGDGVAVRLGQLDDRDGHNPVAARLGRFDAVWAALQRSGERARLIYLDNRARPERVTVKLAAPPPARKADLKSDAAPPDGADSET